MAYFFSKRIQAHVASGSLKLQLTYADIKLSEVNFKNVFGEAVSDNFVLGSIVGGIGVCHKIRE